MLGTYLLIAILGILIQTLMIYLAVKWAIEKTIVSNLKHSNQKSDEIISNLENMTIKLGGNPNLYNEIDKKYLEQKDKDLKKLKTTLDKTPEISERNKLQNQIKDIDYTMKIESIKEKMNI